MDSLQRFRDRLDTILSIESIDGLRQCTKDTMTEGDLVHVANLLEHGAKKIEWAKRPRLFAVLYIIGCMDDGTIMDEFIRLGYKDTSLPFGDPLPSLLKSHKARFKENQKRIFTGVSDLENGRGHQYFEDGDKYYLEGQLLGFGKHAYVYEVFSQQSFERFARKMFNKPRRPDEALRISQAVADEVEHLKRISHRHLVKFIGSYTDMKYIAILMQPVARCNLLEFLNQSQLPPADKSRLPFYFGCLANALQYLHAPPRRIKHKDLKPGNILVSSEGRVLITDFGSATSFMETGQSTTMGSEFTFTADYAPREVVELKPRNTKVDVFSLGAVFFEMWTVLKGESITNMKSYFLANGSHGGNIRTNPIAFAEWAEHVLALPGHPSINEPIGYIRKMIEDNPQDRPDMDEVVLETVGFGQTSRFCCPECMSEYTHATTFPSFHASHLNPTIPRSNSAAPEMTTSSIAADTASLIIRPESETRNSTGTAAHQPKSTGFGEIALDLPPVGYGALLEAYSAQTFVPERMEPPALDSFSPTPSRKSIPIMFGDMNGREASLAPLSGVRPPSTISNSTGYPAFGRRQNAPTEAQKLAIRKRFEGLIRETDINANKQPKTAFGPSPKADNSTRNEAGRTNIPPTNATAAVERDVAQAFKNFALQQRKNVDQPRSESRSEKAKLDKNVKLADLKKFGGAFKLSTPVPSDLMSIIAKDPFKQKQIREREMRDFKPSGPVSSVPNIIVAKTPVPPYLHMKLQSVTEAEAGAGAGAEAEARKAKQDEEDEELERVIREIEEAEAKRDKEAEREAERLEDEREKKRAEAKTKASNDDMRLYGVAPSITPPPLPSITEVRSRKWKMPENFDWTSTEMMLLIRLKQTNSPQEFRRAIVQVLPERSGSNVKKFWTAFCLTNNLRTGARMP